MLISDLDAVNGVLRELGEQPLTSLDTNYPTADLAKSSLVTARYELLQKGWWFNTAINFAIPTDGAGHMPVPTTTLEFIPNDPSYVWSGGYLMTQEGNSTFPVGTIARGTLKFDLPMSGLPWAAQQLVVLMAAAKIYAEDFGPDSKYQEILMRTQELTVLLSAQHVRAKRPNMRQRPAVQEYYRSLFT